MALTACFYSRQKACQPGCGCVAFGLSDIDLKAIQSVGSFTDNDMLLVQAVSDFKSRGLGPRLVLESLDSVSSICVSSGHKSADLMAVVF